MTAYGKPGKQNGCFPPFPQTLKIDQTGPHIPNAISTPSHMGKYPQKEPSAQTASNRPFMLIL
jgi:hypothetical protein